MKFDPYTMKPTTIEEYRIVVKMGTDPDAELPDDLYGDDMFGPENHLTVTDVFRVHAEFGDLDHDMVRRAMGPNWPAEWNERTAIFKSRDCFDCGTTGQCHMNCGPSIAPAALQEAGR